MTRILDEQSAEVAAGRTGLAQDAAFHTALAHSTHNRAITRIVTTLMDLLRPEPARSRCPSRAGRSAPTGTTGTSSRRWRLTTPGRRRRRCWLTSWGSSAWSSGATTTARRAPRRSPPPADRPENHAPQTRFG